MPKHARRSQSLFLLSAFSALSCWAQLAAAGELRAWRRRGQELSGAFPVTSPEQNWLREDPVPNKLYAEQNDFRHSRMAAAASCQQQNHRLLCQEEARSLLPQSLQVVKRHTWYVSSIWQDSAKAIIALPGCVDMQCPGQRWNQQTTALRSNRGCSLRSSQILQILQAQARKWCYVDHVACPFAGDPACDMSREHVLSCRCQGALCRGPPELWTSSPVRSG